MCNSKTTSRFVLKLSPLKQQNGKNEGLLTKYRSISAIRNITLYHYRLQKHICALHCIKASRLKRLHGLHLSLNVKHIKIDKSFQKASTTDFRHPYLQWMTLDKPLTLDQSFVKLKNGWTHEKKLGRYVIRGEYWNNFFHKMANHIACSLACMPRTLISSYWTVSTSQFTLSLHRLPKM